MADAPVASPDDELELQPAERTTATASWSWPTWLGLFTLAGTYSHEVTWR